MPLAVAATLAAVALALGPAASGVQAGAAARTGLIDVTIEGFGGKIAGLKCGAYDKVYDRWSCTKKARMGSKVSLVASVRRAKWAFSDWDEACKSTPRPTGGHTQDTECKLTITKPQTEVIARFIPTGH
jgi:hypothetical protein